MKIKYFLKNKKIEIYTILIISVLSLLIFREYLFNGMIFATQKGIKSDLLRINLPTYIYLFDSLTNGIHFWSWEMGIGTSSFTHADCFFDPFTYIMFLGGRKNIANLMIWSLIIKLLFEGLSFSFYIRQYCKHSWSIVISSVCYAFCGYSLIMGSNLALGTIMVYFPLVLLGIDKLIKKKTIKFLIFSLSLVGLLSFYYLFLTAGLSCLYTVVKSVKEKKSIIKNLLYLLCSGIISFCICGFTLLPQLDLLLNNSRVNTAKDIVWSFNLFKPKSKILLLFLVRSIGINLFGDCVKTDYVINQCDYYQIESYVTCLFPLFFIIFWNLKNDKRKDLLMWSIIIVIFVSFPIFSFLFNACSTINYRWMFGIHVAITSLIAFTIDAMIDNENCNIKRIKNSFIISLITIISLLLSIKKTSNLKTIAFINHLLENQKYIICIAIIYLLFYLIIIFSGYLHNNKKNKYLIYILSLSILCLEYGINYSEWFGKNLQNSFTEDSIYGYDDSSEKIILHIKQNDKSNFYRIYKDFDSVYDSYGIPSDNDAMAQQYYGLKNYSSQNNPSYVNFLQQLGVYVSCNLDVERLKREKIVPDTLKGATLNYINGIDDNYLLLDYLGVKYYLKKSCNNHPIDLNNYELLYSEKGIDVFKNLKAYNLAFFNLKYMEYEDFKRLNFQDRTQTLMNTTIINNNSVKTTYSFFRNKNICNLISFSNNEILFKTKVNNEKDILCFSIPYDKNWNIYIDGEKTDSQKVNISLLGVELNKGSHIVKLKYIPTAFIYGCIISFISVTLLSFFIYKKKDF